jgi:hypothetical protein
MEGDRDTGSERASEGASQGGRDLRREKETQRQLPGRKRGYVDIMHEKGREIHKQREREADGANRGVARLTRCGRFYSWALYRL